MTVAAAVRAEVQGLERKHRAERYPRALRERAVEVARELRAGGMSWRRVAAEVGVRAETLRRWCDAGPRETEAQFGPGLVPVRVVADGGGRGVALVSPRGWRVEGLSLADAASLLRSLA